MAWLRARWLEHFLCELWTMSEEAILKVQRTATGWVILFRQQHHHKDLQGRVRLQVQQRGAARQKPWLVALQMKATPSCGKTVVGMSAWNSLSGSLPSAETLSPFDTSWCHHRSRAQHTQGLRLHDVTGRCWRLLKCLLRHSLHGGMQYPGGSGVEFF